MNNDFVRNNSNDSFDNNLNSDFHSDSQSFPDFEEFCSSFSNNNSSDNDNFSFNNSSGNSSTENNFNMFSGLDMNTILKMKNIMEKMNQKKNDPRSNLLLSLKPYLKDSRKEKVDQYIQIFNMSSIIEGLNLKGGESK